jgi:hypothetical protein
MSHSSESFCLPAYVRTLPVYQLPRNYRNTDNDLPRFYYGDQRHADGGPFYTGLSGPAHADAYFELAQKPEQGPWQYTFVEGSGYKQFPKLEVLRRSQ